MGHKYIDATCTEPKTCSRCGKAKGSATGHNKGEWTLTQEATLVDYGTEKVFCVKCDEVLDKRTTEKKTPKVIYDCFNFTDDELIDWVNDKSTAHIGHTDIGLFDDDSSNTSYKITSPDGDTGVLMLNHGDNEKDENIQSIMIYFDNGSFTGSLGIWIGNEIDSDFNVDDAITKLIYDKPYTAANMTGMTLELDVGFEVYLLAPSEYVADLLS